MLPVCQLWLSYVLFFFFKQKTAYGLRIRYWSSDVCSSDLAPWIFGAVEIVLPDYNLLLLDGASELTINGNLYKGEDATFGTLAAISTLSEEIGEEAPEISIELYPPNASAMATLCNPNM